jgi:hypothetical protein
MAFNERLWRRGQLIGTGVLSLVCAPLLLCLAYLAATSPAHRPSEAVALLLVGLLPPPLFYWAFKAVIAMRRAREPDAEASLRSTRIMKSRYAPFLAAIPIGIMLSLNQGLGRLNEHMKQDPSSPGQAQSLASRQAATMRAACSSSMETAALHSGAAPKTAAVSAIIDKYCTCFVVQVQSQHTPAEIELLESDSARMAQDPTLNRAAEFCRAGIENP